MTDQRAAVAVGAGLELGVPKTPFGLRAALEGQVQDIRVSVNQPTAGQRDGASRLLPGWASETDLLWRVGPKVDMYAGWRAASLGKELMISVHGAPGSVIPEVSYGVLVGCVVTLR